MRRTSLLAACVLLGAMPFLATANQRAVILHSYHDGFSWTDGISSGIRDGFAHRAGQVELCFEYMDARRVSSDAYFASLAEALRVKYAGRAVDVIMAVDDHAFSFACKYGREIFGAVPMVFCSVTGYTPGAANGWDVTGLRESVDIAETLDAALRLHPGRRHVTVISDTTKTGLALDRKARDVFARYAPEVTFSYLNDLSMDELESRVEALGDGDMVFLFLFNRDKQGVVLSHELNLKCLARHCRVPIYAVWDFYLGHGIVGGKLTSGHDEGLALAQIAERVLSGEHASEIPIGNSPTRYLFDYRKLVEFDVGEKMLPEGSVVINKPFSLYQAYGQLIWTAITVFGIMLLLVILLFLDIAQRRRSQQRLQDKEERLQLVLQGAELGMWDWDIGANRLLVNDRWMSMLGYDGCDPRPEATSPFDAILAEDAGRAQLAFARHEAGETSFYESEHRVKKVTGGYLWVVDRGKIVKRDGTGKPLRVTGTRADVSRRKTAEEQQRALESQVQHAQKLESLGVLAGGIAHDFNNLLTGILGNADLSLQDVSAGSAARESLEDIKKSARKAAELCRQMLAYSGKGKFVIKRLDLSLIVKEMAQLLRVSISPRVRLHYNMAEDLPLLEGDSAQTGQVVMNLITNASEAIGDGEGTVTLSTGVKQCDADYLKTCHGDRNILPGDYVYLEVSDTGCGMDADTIERIFDPFFTTKFTGRGLGLSAVLGIIRGHLGAIRIYSEPGKGSTFRVLFPVADEQSESPHAQENSGAEANLWKGQGTVLMVDDDEMVRRSSARMLKRMGFEVIAAQDGNEALAAFRARNADVTCVLLDLTMPNMDGVECFARLREMKPGLPVILSSGYNEQDATQRFAGRGLTGFIQKPYVYEALREALRNATT